MDNEVLAKNPDFLTLFVAARSGNPQAYNALMLALYERRKSFFSLGNYSLFRRLDEGEANHAFFRAEMAAYETFRPELGHWETYFVTILAHEMAKVAEEEGYFRGTMVYSLDAELLPSEGNYCLHDAIPAGSEEDPRIYYNYVEQALALGKLRKRINATMLKVVRFRLQGVTYSDIGKALNMSLKRARSLYLRYEKFVRDGIKFGGDPITKTL